jgi:hypothetical protein
MTIEEAVLIVKTVQANHVNFRPLSTPTPTVGGYRITFEQVGVLPNTVATWFAAAGGVVTLCGVENCYADVPTWICEYRLPR